MPRKGSAVLRRSFASTRVCACLQGGIHAALGGPNKASRIRPALPHHFILLKAAEVRASKLLLSLSPRPRTMASTRVCGLTLPLFSSPTQ